jgi:DNA repair protein RecO (recombination protein O)
VYNPRMPSRERLYRTEAVVLRRGDLGEADRILTVYSPEHGKLRLVAKGVRKVRSRKAGHLEPFTRVELQIARGHDLDVITQAEAADLHTGLHRDLERFGYAAYVVELMDRFTVQEGESRALYRLLVDTLDRLAEPSEPAAVVAYYQLRLLDLLGYRPELFRCLGCGAEVRPVDHYFSAVAGGVLCPECGPRRHEARSLSLPVLKVLRHFQRSTFDQALQPRVRFEILDEVGLVLEGYVSYLLERRLQAPAFVRQVRHLDTLSLAAPAK